MTTVRVFCFFLRRPVIIVATSWGDQGSNQTPERDAGADHSSLSSLETPDEELPHNQNVHLITAAMWRLQVTPSGRNKKKTEDKLGSMQRSPASGLYFSLSICCCCCCCCCCCSFSSSSSSLEYTWVTNTGTDFFKKGCSGQLQRRWWHMTNSARVQLRTLQLWQTY